MDLSFLPDQPKTKKIIKDDLSFLPDQQEDISFLPDQVEKPKTTVSALQQELLVRPDSELAHPAKPTVSPMERTPEEIAKLKPEPLNIFDAMGEIRDEPGKLVPFASSALDIAKLTNLAISAGLLNAGKEVGEKELKDLQDFIDFSERDRTFGYNVASIVSQMPAFAGEIMATKGAYTIPALATKRVLLKTLRKITGKSFKELLKKRLLVKIPVKGVASLAGSVGRLIPSGITRIPLKTAENQLTAHLEGNEETITKSLVKSAGAQYIEVASEMTGGLFGELSTGAKGFFLKKGLFKAILRKNPMANPSKVYKLVKGYGYHGIPGEMFEEEVARRGHGLLANIGFGNEPYKAPTPTDLLTEFVAFSVPGITFKMADRMVKGVVDKKRKEKLGKFQDEVIKSATRGTGISPDIGKERFVAPTTEELLEDELPEYEDWLESRVGLSPTATSQEQEEARLQEELRLMEVEQKTIKADAAFLGLDKIPGQLTDKIELSAIPEKPAEPTARPAQTPLLAPEETENFFWNDKEENIPIEEKGKEGLIKLFHGTNTNIDKIDMDKTGIRDIGDLGSGFYITESKKNAEYYADQMVKNKGGKRNITEIELSKEAKILDVDENIYNEFKNAGLTFPTLTKKNADQVKKYVLDKGYDGLRIIDGHKFIGGDVNDIVIFNPNIIKVKQKVHAPGEKLKEQKAEIKLPDKKPSFEGKQATVHTDAGTEVKVRYALVEADKLIASHDTELNVNKKFPASLQPRERGRAVSVTQIANIASKLNPAFLGESPKASEGAPIIGRDFVVESGNARTIALQSAYAGKYKESAAKYKAWLKENALHFRISKEDVAKMKTPVLVRIRETAVDRRQFVEEANQSSIMAMSSTEEAKIDAGRLTPDLLNMIVPGENGEILTVPNQPFIRAFMQTVIGPSDVGRYVTSEGTISQQGVQRIKTAIFAKAYGSEQAVQMLSEDTDANVKNILNGMFMAAPKTAILNETIAAGAKHDLSVSEDIGKAAEKLSLIRQQGLSVSSYINQTDMFGEGLSPIAANFMAIFEKYKQAPRKIGEIINGYADIVNGLGDPRQATLEALNIPDKETVLDLVLKKINPYSGQSNQSGFVFEEGGTYGKSVRNKKQKATQYKPLFEIKYRKDGALYFPGQEIFSPEDVAFAFRQLKNEAVEHCYIVGVNEKQVVSVELISIGSINASIVDLMEPINLLMISGAKEFYMVHNHPSGMVKPSVQDYAITDRFERGYKQLGLSYAGHIIIDHTKFGFIDTDRQFTEINHKLSEGTHKEFALQKYLKWKESTEVIEAQKEIGGVPEAAAAISEIIKGTQTNLFGDSVVLYLNNQNVIMATEILPPSQFIIANIATKASAVRSNQIILANIPVQFSENEIKENLESLGFGLLDIFTIDNNGYRSWKEDTISGSRPITLDQNMVRDSDWSKNNDRAEEIINSSVSIIDAQERIANEFGVKLSVEQLETMKRKSNSGVFDFSFTREALDQLVSTIRRDKEHAKIFNHLGLENFDIDPEALKESMSIMGVANEKFDNLKLNFKHLVNQIEQPQIYLYYDKTTKPIAESVIDARQKLLKNLSFIETWQHTAGNVDHPEAMKKLAAEVDRDPNGNMFAALQIALKKGIVNEKDVDAYTKAYYYMHKYTYDAIRKEIIEGKTGIRIKYMGDYFNISYTLKSGARSQRMVTEAELKYLQGKYGDVKIWEQKQKYSFKKLSPETGKYEKNNYYLDDYQDALDMQDRETKELLDELLPYSPDKGNYFPHSREQGGWWVEAFDMNSEGKEKLFSARVPLKVHADAIAKEMGAKFGAAARIKVRADSKRDKFMPSMGKMIDMVYFLNQSGVKVNSEAGQKIINGYRQMSGLFSHLIHAKNIPGFKTEWKSLSDSISQIARSAAKREFRADIEDIFDLITPDQVPDDFRANIATRYLKIMSSLEHGNSILDTAMNITYFAALANKINYITQNMSEAIWALARVPNLNSDIKFLIPLEQEYRDLLLKAKQEGVIKPFFVEEVERSGLMRKFDILGRASEVWSSKKSFEIGLRIARDKKLHGEEAYREASQFLFNVAKPFYNPANKINLLLRSEAAWVRKYGFIFLTWSMGFFNQFAHIPMKGKILTVLFWSIIAGVGTLPIPYLKTLMMKLGIVDKQKNFRKYDLMDRFLLGGLVGMLGISSRFIVPSSFRGFGNLGDVTNSINILASMLQRAKMGYKKYGIPGFIAELPIGGAQQPIKAGIILDKGYIAGSQDKPFYKPKSVREKAVTAMGYTPFEVGEKYDREGIPFLEGWGKKKTRTDLMKKHGISGFGKTRSGGFGRSGTKKGFGK